MEARDGQPALPAFGNADVQRMTHPCQWGTSLPYPRRTCGPHDAGSCKAVRDDASTALDLALRSWRRAPGLVHRVASHAGMCICYVAR